MTGSHRSRRGNGANKKLKDWVRWDEHVQKKRGEIEIAKDADQDGAMAEAIWKLVLSRPSEELARTLTQLCSQASQEMKD